VSRLKQCVSMADMGLLDMSLTAVAVKCSKCVKCVKTAVHVQYDQVGHRLDLLARKLEQLVVVKPPACKHAY
jgi:hypothetical protein